MAQFTLDTIEKVAVLALLSLTQKEKEKFLPQLSEILDFISQLQSYDTKNIEPTAQVTGLTNVFREDVVDESRVFTQAQALSNAKQTYRGFIQVPSIFED